MAIASLQPQAAGRHDLQLRRQRETRARVRRRLLHGLAESVAEVRIRQLVLRARRVILDLHAVLTDEGAQDFEVISVFGKSDRSQYLSVRHESSGIRR